MMYRVFIVTIAIGAAVFTYKITSDLTDALLIFIAGILLQIYYAMPEGK